MELKFGCEIERLGVYLAKTPDDEEYYFCPKETDVNGEAQVFCVEKWSGYKIRGRPIRLADVLLAIKEARHFAIKSIEAAEKLEALMEQHGVDNELEYLWEHYDLRNDSLEAQSEETIKFIDRLLPPQL